jgi:hypothetical protein
VTGWSVVVSFFRFGDMTLDVYLDAFNRYCGYLRDSPYSEILTPLRGFGNRP